MVARVQAILYRGSLISFRMVAAAFVFIFIPIAAAFAKDIDVTVYAVDSYPPYSYAEAGEVKGIYTEILRTAFTKMKGFNITIQPLPWKRSLRLLEYGTGFALYPPYFHVLKRPYIWPYSLPILDETVVVFCRESVMKDNPRPNWPEDYYGLVIGNNAGFYIGGDRFWRSVKENKIKVQEAKGNRENLLMIGLGRTDCYMNDRLSILLELGRLKREGIYREGSEHARLIEGTTISIEQGFLGYTDRDEGKFGFKQEFKKQLDIIIYNMRKSGEIQGIIDKALELH